MRKERIRERNDFFFSSQPFQTNFCLIIQLTLLGFASASSINKTSPVGILDLDLTTLDNIASRAHVIEIELG